jgi:hypothetical protein
MNIVCAQASAALSSNGDNTGYASVASNTPFFVGAIVFLRSTTVTKRCIITELKSTTQVGLRFIADDNEKQLPIQVYGGRSDLTAFTTANSATIFQESQLVRIDPNYTKPLPTV